MVASTVPSWATSYDQLLQRRPHFLLTIMTTYLPKVFSRLPKVIIFDLDGTLYDQTKLRLYMLYEMTKFCLRHPTQISEIILVWHFRRLRKRNSSLRVSNLEEQQYDWVAKVVRKDSGIVRLAVKKWLFERPLCYLPKCCYSGVSELFSFLRDQGVRIGVFSDYPIQAKLEALGLSADVTLSACDKEVSRLKPDPTGLFLIAQKLQTPLQDCLFIGDKDEKDGECARRAGIPYVILQGRKKPSQLAQIHCWFRNGKI